MKLITRDTDYALRALAFMAKRRGEVVSAAELVKKLEMPRPFLRKLLQKLNSKKILKSFKGGGGGFKLNKNPKDISLNDLMRIFQGKISLNECIFKKKKCPNRDICALRRKICRIEKYVIRHLKPITLASLL